MKIIPVTSKLSTLIMLTVGMGMGLSAQDEFILPAQKEAIRTLAKSKGFDDRALELYLIQNRGLPLDSLTKKEAAEIIRQFQSGSVSASGEISPPQQPVLIHEKPVKRTPEPVEGRRDAIQKQASPKIAEILEVGMAKRFHLIDGNIILGEIVKIEDGVCHIETIDGLLQIPASEILEETVEVTKKDDARYIGPVLKESSEEIVIRSKYGDVVISKRDVKSMDRYHGGRLMPWAEEKKTFLRGEAVLTDIFMDPTAFPLEPHVFYISGLSLGYGFTERFMVRTKFGSDFSGDLNIQPHLRFYHRQTGTSKQAAAIGGYLYNHHPMETVVAKYARYVENSAGGSLDTLKGVNASDVLSEQDQKSFYWEIYTVISSRRSLPTRRGEVGWHIGFRTNSLILEKPALKSGYKWDENELKIPFRLWAGFEYDLTKNLKLSGLIWADNGHRFRTITESWRDYIKDTPFILDSKEGEYRMVDFDFGFLYAFSETFRIGIHFQEPFLVFYWEFFEL